MVNIFSEKGSFSGLFFRIPESKAGYFPLVLSILLKLLGTAENFFSENIFTSSEAEAIFTIFIRRFLDLILILIFCFCHFVLHLFIFVLLSSILNTLMDDLKTRKSKTSRSQRVLRGLYSSGGHYSDAVAYALRFPQAIFTLSSALSLYQMTDYFLEPPFDLAFPRGSRIYHDPKVNQHFESPSELHLGVTTVLYEGRKINIYDRERLLIEIFHAKNKMGPERYKAAIHAYREIGKTNLFSFPRFESYCHHFRFSQSYPSRFFLEVL